ncbi:Ig-like domain-containing protein [Campylobacterota bacterium]
MKPLLLFVLSLSFFAKVLTADIEPTNNTCPSGETIPDITIPIIGSVQDGGDTIDNYSYLVSTTGELVMDVVSDERVNVWFSTDNTSSCQNNQILSSLFTGQGRINVTAGETVYIAIQESTTAGKTADYSLTFYSAPIANDDDALVVSSAVDINVTDNDQIIDASAIDLTTVTIVSPPADGTATVDPVTGVITYTPGAGYGASDSFTYTVRNTDGIDSNVATVNIRNVLVSFEYDAYNLSEDLLINVGLYSSLPIKILLSEPAPEDIEVTYTTRDGTAINGLDYRDKTDRVTIPEGSTELTIYIWIYHDAPIELAEIFYVDLINPEPGALGSTDSTEITILGQNTAPLCYEDDFSTDLDSNWRTLYSSGGFTPEVDSGRLRLTEDANGQATAVTKDYEFIASQNLIVIEFDQYAYGGNGADGIGVVLYDSLIGASPAPGAFGGSLGYAQKCEDGVDGCNSDCTVSGGCPGFEGGWLGLALDEYGNYANPTEGRDGGPGFRADTVSIRGDGSGTTGYEYLEGSTTLSPGLDDTSSSLYTSGRYRMTIDARDPAHLYISLERDIGLDGTYETTIINLFDAKDAAHGQGPTPQYVRMALTASTGGLNNIHEIDNLRVYGVCSAYNPNPTGVTVGNADVVNDFIDQTTYNDYGSRYITTKTAAKTETFTGVHLNDFGLAEIFSPIETTQAFRIIPYLSNSDCTEQEVLLDTNGDPAVISIFNGEVSKDIEIVMPDHAAQDARIKVTSLDFDEAYGTNGESCILGSSTTGNLQGLSSCLNDINKYTRAFGQEAVNRCYTGNGAPCLSQNGGQSCGQQQQTDADFFTDPAAQAACGFNPAYADDYGCLMCTLDINATCSSDNFAIRPEEFSVSLTDPDSPDLLRSGDDYNLTLFAYDNGVTSGTNGTDEYDVANASAVLTIDKDLLLRNGTLATASQMTGNISWSSYNFSFTDGVATPAGIQFSDVGKVTLKVQDRTWAAVDINDVNGLRDPTQGACPEDDPYGAWICGENNVTFIPHHFGLSDINITNNSATAGYTYYANITDGVTSTYGMGARINVKITAQNALNGTTQNFKSGTNFYEHPVAVSSTVNNANLGTANSTTIPSSLLGFGTGSDANGTKTITRNESDLLKVLRFNYPRAVNVPLNPVSINPTDVDITAMSIYTEASTPSSPAAVTGTGTGAGLTGPTFYYGRSHAPRTRIADTTGTATFYYEVYCNGTDVNGVSCAPGSALISSISAGSLLSVDDIRWFQNTSHNNVDGNISSTAQKNGITNNIAIGAPVNATTTTVQYIYDPTVGDRGYPYKTTMNINNSDWLLYNRFDPAAAVNNFELEFSSSGAWSGEANATMQVDQDSAINTNRRIQW